MIFIFSHAQIIFVASFYEILFEKTFISVIFFLMCTYTLLDFGLNDFKKSEIFCSKFFFEFIPLSLAQIIF